MGWRSSVLIAVLILGVLFSSLYKSAQVSMASHTPNFIPTEPKISQLQAIEIAEQHLRKQSPNLEEAWLYFSFYNFTSERFSEAVDPDYVDYIRSVASGGWKFSNIKEHPELLQLPIFFVHANGTQYVINGTSHSIIGSYAPEPTCRNCGLLGFSAIQNAAKDRLVYKFEVSGWKPYNSKQTPIPFSAYVIDAESGNIIWNSIDFEKSKSLIPKVQFYDNSTNLPKTIKQLDEERQQETQMALHPPRMTVIEIVKGAAMISQKDHFVPKEARAVIQLDNKIEWVNNDQMVHTVTSDTEYTNGYSGKFDSGMIEAGAKYDYTFTDIGEYPYHCQIHPFMTGKIVIVDDFA